LTRPLTILLVCVAVGAALYFLIPHRGSDSTRSQADSAGPVPAIGQQSPSNPEAPLVSSPEESPDAAAIPSTFPTAPVAPATPFLLGSADTPPKMEPATVLGNLRIAIGQYGSRFGGNPVGTNPEITKALNGDNPKQVKFISEESGLRINARGELVDYWGTPFFFHQLSGAETELRSAGPDRVMWTADDLVTK
jgi:hypothetical protein